MPFMPSAALLSNQGGFYPVGTAARYVAATGGSGGNDGLSPKTAMATIQAAYDSLPASGGALILLPGTHSVGTGFVGANHKPCVVTSIVGLRTNTGNSGAVTPIVTGTGTALFTVGATGGHIDAGWSFRDIYFDMDNAAVLSGVQCNDINYCLFIGCQAQDVNASLTAAKYMVRSNHPVFDDVSWYRFENNWCANVGLCSLADGEGDGNCNNNQIYNNVIFPATNSWAVRTFNMERSFIYANHIDGAGLGGIRLDGAGQFNYIIGNGGEGGSMGANFLYLGGSTNENVYLNYGDARTNLNASVTDLAGKNYNLAPRPYIVNNFTGDHTLDATDSGTLIRMNVAGANNLTVPPGSSVLFVKGISIRINQRGAGQTTVVQGAGVTVRSPGGLGLKLRAQYSMATLEYVGGDEWILSGDVAA